MFPDVSYSDILEDLQHTHSLEVTIDNILEQRLVNPPPMFASHDGPSSVFEVQKEDEKSHQLLSEQEETKEEEEDFVDASPTPSRPLSLPVPFELDAATTEDPSDTESEGSGIGVGISGAGGRFSKSPQEREQMLAQRKTELLSQARRRFVAKPKVMVNGMENSQTDCDSIADS
ncbi:E3 ubiquitin-protein ligase AMFR-like [Penaeus indicus]|uniref:E3 ubiquitin-protein ligase AMFR-like n=1 Tax=Penaeus indicus TaxID=29960 RepID=UPI00300C5871